jgi:hypothetical protein
VKLGIMQPYFFPYAQQLRHIGQCDRWIVFDTPQFTRKSWITRNRIADRNTGWSYISVPVSKGASTGPIADATLAASDWRGTLRDRLRVYENAAPYYAEVADLVGRCVAPDVRTVAELNTRILVELCAALQVPTPIERLSALRLDLPDTAEPGEWALLISTALGASEYSNAPGGRHLFDPDRYRERGVALDFYEPIPLQFPTPGFDFTPDLSIIDPLMWQGIDATAQWCRAA